MFVYLKRIEKVIITSLIVLIVLVICVSIIELAWIIIKKIFEPPILFLEITDLLEIFDFFLLILIGIELMETIKVYAAEKEIPAKVVLLVTTMAVARKVMVLDIKQISPLTLVGIGIIIIALIGGYYLMARSYSGEKQNQPIS